MSRRARLAASIGTDSGSPGHLQAGHEAFLPPKTPLPASCTRSHSHGSPRHPRANGSVREGLGCWGLPVCVMKLLTVLSYPSFSADPGRGCCWGLVHGYL